MAKSSSKVLPNAANVLKIETQKANRENGERAINAACKAAIDSILAANTVRDDAETKWEIEKGNAQGAREQAMITLAKLSFDKAMTPDAIDNALNWAIKASFGNAAEKPAARVMKSELRQAMLPEVREHTPRIINEAVKAWNAETDKLERAEDPKKVDAPLRRVYKRRHHMLVTLLRAAKPASTTTGPRGARVTTTPKAVVVKSAAEIVKTAAAVPEASAAERAAAKITAIIKSVKELAAEFNRTDTLAPIVEALEGISATTFVGDGDMEAPVDAPTAADEPVDAPAALDAALMADIMALVAKRQTK